MCGLVRLSPKDGAKQMRFVVAVSGGVDSVVLLDMLVRTGGHELIVAHFDHGIRSDSVADGRFVEGLAKKYNLPFVLTREELGGEASEELARNRRYAFLREVAANHKATIVTAHHSDDVVETVAINLIRGTGWRGLAVLGSKDIIRPLIRYSKDQIIAYALAHRLEWVEDHTNASERYLRNRVRRAVRGAVASDDRHAVYELWRRQLGSKTAIDTELTKFIRPDGQYSRYFFIYIEPDVACELLRVAVSRIAGAPPTRPQAERALLAIKAARARTQYEIGDGARLRFTARTFIVETP